MKVMLPNLRRCLIRLVSDMMTQTIVLCNGGASLEDSDGMPGGAVVAALRGLGHRA